MARLKIHGYEVESVNSGGGAVPIPKDTTTPALENVTFTGMTTGSVLFIGANGALTEDNTKLFWDDTNNRLGIGITTPGAQLNIDSAGSSNQFRLGNGTNSWDINRDNAVTGRLMFYHNNPGTEIFSILPQGRVGITNVAPDASAALDITSTTKGFLPPRMTTTQRDAISSPLEGLIVYNVTTHKLNVRTASAWEAITSA